MRPLDMTREQLAEFIGDKSEKSGCARHGEAQKKKEKKELPLFQKKFGLLLSTASVGLIITDVSGKIISFNKTIGDMLGIGIDEYRDTNVSDLYAHPQDRKRLIEMLSASRVVRDFEVEVKHKNGTLRTVLANIDYIELNNDHVLLTSLYDITQNKQLQDGAEGQEDSYRTLFSKVPVGITVTDYQGNLVIGNNAVKELLGYSSDELSDMNVWDFYFSPTDRYRLLELTRRLGVVRDFETVLKHKSGKAIAVLINTDRIELNSGKNMMLTSIRDISNLKRAEDELKEERDFSDAILNIAATLIVVLDRNGKINRYNRACEQKSGYTAVEVCETYLWDTVFFDPVMTREEIDRLLSDNYPGAFENVLVSKSGERYNISWTFAAMYDQEGHVEFIIATGIDITKRQQIEDKLQKANEELACRVEELSQRTEEMNQLNEMGEQLQSCQTIAEACAVSAQYIKRICPASRGALCLLSELKDSAKAVEMWGEPGFTQEAFAPLDCWAIRRGRSHLVNKDHPGLRCEHIKGPQSGEYLCVPLLVNGEAIGILHLNNAGADARGQPDMAGPSYNEHKQQLVTTIAEHIALAISNLNLRETLRQQSIRDVLTGLFNRRYLQETLERELIRAKREEKPVGIIMLDIDHFKEYNDHLGHDAGDALLRELGTFLKKTARGGDIICRYGGEEFLLVLPGANAENTRAHAEKLRQGVKKLQIDHLGIPLDKCTISIGVAVFPENGTAGDTLLKAADSALYRAKNEGRDKIETA